MPTFSADQIVGKKLYAAKRLTAHTHGDKKAPIVKVFQPGELVGTVFSWVEPSSGVWWAFSGGNLPDMYVRHERGAFDWEKLKQQLDPSLIPSTNLNIPPEVAGGMGLAALFFEDRGRNEGEKLAIRGLGYFGIGYALWKIVTKKVGEIDFNPFN